MNAMNLTLPQRTEDRLFTEIALSRTALAPCLVLHLGINNSDDLMRPKFQKQRALKFDGRIIPEAKPSGINVGLILRPLGREFVWIPRCLRRGCSFPNL